jgi:hypothetical protein
LRPSAAQLRALVKATSAREMARIAAERARRGQPCGNGREWDWAFGGMSRLPEKHKAKEVGDSISS